MKASTAASAVLVVMMVSLGAGAQPTAGAAGSAQTAAAQTRSAATTASAVDAAARPGARLASAARPLRGSSRWRLTKPARGRQIEGYALRVSALPGTAVPLRVSTGAQWFRVEAYRFGAYIGGAARRIWSSRWVPGERQGPPRFASYSRRTVVARWHRSLLMPTAGWPAGDYLLKLITGSGWQSYIPYVVRSANARGRLALVTPVATWQAYNTWGGYSLYQGPIGDRRSWAVSFDRPYKEPGQAGMLYSVRSLVVRAERLGIPLAYTTNVDLAADRHFLDGARGYVSMGHDEYWSPSMRRRVVVARAAGTNLAFFGSNTMYWRIRLENAVTGPNRVVVGYRTDAALDPMRYRHPALTTARWRDPPVPRPENTVTGMQYECFPVDAPYRIAAPGWWGFQGTGVTRGTRFAHLVGVEADRVYPIRSTPRPLQVLSYARYSCRGVGTSTESEYYTTRSGAGVFDVGTMRWTCALNGYCAPYVMPRRTIRFVAQVTGTILRTFAAGPAGRTHPARDNVARFPLPRVNQVPAS